MRHSGSLKRKRNAAPCCVSAPLHRRLRSGASAPWLTRHFFHARAMALTSVTFSVEGEFSSLAAGESLAVLIGVSEPVLLSKREGREGVTVLSSIPLSLPSNMVASYRYAVVPMSGGRVLVR
jgi:hypothetical protein